MLPIAACILIGAICGAIGRRVAGGGFQDWTGLDVGDLPVRLFFAAMIGLAAYVAGALWWHALALVPATWVGTTTGNGGVFFKGGIGMGREPSGSVWQDSLGLTAHGVLSAIIPCAGMWWLGYAWVWTAIAYLSIAMWYEIGWSLMGKTGRPLLPKGFQNGVDAAEVLWGAAIGAGTVLSVALR